VQREIVGYDPEDEAAFSAPVDLPTERLAELRALLSPGDDTDLVNVYELTGSALGLVERWLDTRLDPDLAYYLETAG
jgi:hypothetical protein